LPWEFQSTHPRGVRLNSEMARAILDGNFNPRTHVGCDQLLRRRRRTVMYFNPRTHVGCDLSARGTA